MGFTDLRELLDRALSSERGLAVRLETPGQATNLVQRINYFRRQNKIDSRDIYPADHPMFNRSAYDALRVYKPALTSCEVCLDKFSTEILEVREL